LLWAFTAVGFVAGISLLAIYFAGREPNGVGNEASTTVTSPLVAPGPVVDRFLAAWATSDWETVRQLTSDPTSRTDESLAAWWQDLSVVSVQFTAGEPLLGEGTAAVPFHPAVEIEAAGTWEYDSELHLILRRGEWRIDWRPAALHPTLTPGEPLVMPLPRHSRRPSPCLPRLSTISSTGPALNPNGFYPSRPSLVRKMSTFGRPSTRFRESLSG
jgi:hypothetical protein